MIKRISKFLIYIIFILVLIIGYLSFYGIKTDKFNNKIKNEVFRINNQINLDLKSVKILLNLKNLKLEIKTLNPTIIIDNQKLPLVTVKTEISIKSFLKDQFSIENINISTKTIKINDIILLTRSFSNSKELFLLDKFVKGGYLVADINLNFEENGNIKKDYEINGFIKKGKLNFFNKYNINDLDLLLKIKENNYSIENITTNFNQEKISLPFVKIINENNIFAINGKILSQEKKYNKDIIGFEFNELNIDKINFSSKSDFSFNINKKLKISDLKINSIVDLNYLVYNNPLSEIKKYLPNFKNTLKLQNNKISINYDKKKLFINGNGSISIEDKLDYVTYELIKKDDNYSFETSININNNSILLNIFDYTKKSNLDSALNIKGTYKKDKSIYFDYISLIDEDKNNFSLKNLDLNNKYKINAIDSIDLNFINNKNYENKIKLKKNKNNYELYGASFDASRLIDEIFDNNNKNSKSIFHNLNSKMNLKIDKIYFDKDTFAKNLSGYIEFKKNKIYKSNLNSKFPNSKKISLKIYMNEYNEKIINLTTGYPQPLIQRYKFIKGFEEGFLVFKSRKKDGISKNFLVIDNFKVKEVPVLAKLLSLASLQGLADILTGEGIRFTDLEMKFSNKKDLITIEEMYAIGPAISILMDGYIVSEKLVSLRGTLVPATTINRAIASIPILGSILIGDKTGEGVFGVSFKVKGPPSKLKTTVNPVKTLTPRFITRTLEKIKKN
jgi:hypothetical protein